MTNSSGTTERSWDSGATRPAPGLELSFASQPCGKDISEDFFDAACPAPEDLRRRGVVLALADGLSGGAGRRAAETCVRTVLSDYYGTPPAWDPAYSLDRIIGSVNSWLLSHNLRSGDAPAMLSTLSVLVLNATEFHIAHVGDTRIYRLRGTSMECLTVDHVWPRPDMRHVLRRAVGLDQHLVVDCCSEPLSPGDRFLLLSDGVWEVLGDAGLREQVALHRTGESMVRALVDQAAGKQRPYYGRNDATAALVTVSVLPVPGDG